MKCPTCGGAELVHDTRDVQYMYKGESFILPAVTGDFCPVCEDSIHDGEESTRISEMMLVANINYHRNRKVMNNYEKFGGTEENPLLTESKSIRDDNSENGHFTGGLHKYVSMRNPAWESGTLVEVAHIGNRGGYEWLDLYVFANTTTKTIAYGNAGGCSCDSWWDNYIKFSDLSPITSSNWESFANDVHNFSEATATEKVELLNIVSKELAKWKQS